MSVRFPGRGGHGKGFGLHTHTCASCGLNEVGDFSSNFLVPSAPESVFSGELIDFFKSFGCSSGILIFGSCNAAGVGSSLYRLPKPNCCFCPTRGDTKPNLPKLPWLFKLPKPKVCTCSCFSRLFQQSSTTCANTFNTLHNAHHSQMSHHSMVVFTTARLFSMSCSVQSMRTQ